MTVKTIDKLMLLHQALADEDLNKADVTVLAVLIEGTNRFKGYCWASVGTIAETAGISRRYVQGIIRKLEAKGYVEVATGGDGPRSTNRYFVQFEGRTGRSPLAIRARKAKGEQIAHKGEHPVPKGRTPSSPNTSYDPSYIETLHSGNRGATLQSRDAHTSQTDGFQDEDRRVAAELKRLEAKISTTGDIEDTEAEWLEDICDSYGAQTGDPLGGWAYRLIQGG